MAVKGLRTLDDTGNYKHPLYDVMMQVPGLSVGTALVDDLLTWGLTNSLWIFPMATSCCGIELMATAASRVDADRMGTIVRGTPRQADVMVVAGTITTKMAPRVLKLWQQMPEPRWCIAMGSCAISGDFYRNLYSVVPGIDTFMPVDVYIPGCPPNPESLMAGLIRLQEKVRRKRKGEFVEPEHNPDLTRLTAPSIPQLYQLSRPPELSLAQTHSATNPTLEEAAPATHVPMTDAPPVTIPTAPDLAEILAAMAIELPKNGPPLVPRDAVLPLATRLKELGYAQLVTIVATHWLAKTGRKGADATEPEHFEVAYALRTIGKGSRVAAFSVRLLPGESVPTLTGLYAGADWQEREQFDLVGVPFAGHPDLRRLMMVERYEGHPLRRDFASDRKEAPWR